MNIQKKMYSLIYLLSILLSSVLTADTQATHITKVDGTFIQPWLYDLYTEEQWEGEMKALKEIGVTYLIMGDVANKNPDGTWTVYYKSELDFLKNYFAYDAVSKIMLYCNKYGIKLYLGMGLDTTWNSDLTTVAGREANKRYMEQCNQITQELYTMFKSKYPKAYYGFYFVTELFNTHFMETDAGIDTYAEGLEEMFTMVLDNINKLDSSMPLLFSPYLNIYGYGYSSINVDRFTEYWTEVLTRIPFRGGDMICPQDSCGGGGNDIPHLEEWTKAYRSAVDRSNKARGTKLLLGTNAEMFIQPDAERMACPHGVSYSGIKHVKDFTTRLEIASKYVDQLFCFAYPHHYSPYNTLPEFHESFTKYLRTGVIETELPLPPTKVDIKLVEKEGQKYPEYTFSGMSDNVAVAHTNIYKNGKLYDYIVTAVKVGGNKSQDTWVDYKFTQDKSTFEIEVIDVNGNASKKSSFVLDYSQLKSKGLLSLNTEGPIDWKFTSLDHLSYTVNDYGVRVNGCDKDVTEIVIPNEIEGKPVNVIDWYAFEKCQKLKSVVIPDTVSHISRFAFTHCISLESVTMPKSLYAIEQYAFHDCPKLKGINLPENLNIIEPRAFFGCKSITEVTIPKSVKTVGEYAFLNCNSLDKITINGDAELGLKSIGYEYNDGYKIKDGFQIISSNTNAKTYAKDNGIEIK